MASRQLMITRIAAAGTLFSPLPYQAWHGYRVTNAHRVEVEVSAEGHASAPPSGAAAAALPLLLQGSADAVASFCVVVSTSFSYKKNVTH
jgi:hypothetical protein